MYFASFLEILTEQYFPSTDSSERLIKPGCFAFWKICLHFIFLILIFIFLHIERNSPLLVIIVLEDIYCITYFFSILFNILELCKYEKALEEII